MECPVGNWTKNFLPFPSSAFSEFSITSYKRGHDDNRLKGFTHGYRLFKSNKVMKVLLHYGDEVVVKAVVQASFKVATYNVAIFINSQGEVLQGNCNCIGGIQGRCKHVFALLWYILDCVHQELSHVVEDVACTSVPRTWGRGSNKTRNLSMFDQLKFIKHEPNKHNKSTLKIIEKRNNLKDCYGSIEINSDFLRKCHNNCVNSGLNMLAESIEANGFRASTHYLSSFTAVTYSLPTEELWGEEYSNLCKNYGIEEGKQEFCKISLSLARKLQNETCLQSHSQLWFSERSKRLTASKFYAVISRQAPVTEQFINTVFTKTATFQSREMNIGLRNEAEVIRKLIDRNPNFKYIKCGVCVNPGIPILAASPDGVIYNELTNTYNLLEIKTLVKAMEHNCTIQEAMERKLCDFLVNDGENIFLKKNHKYYMQVQGQLAITGLRYCLFVVDSGKDMITLNIELDVNKWKSEWLQKLVLFYFTNFNFNI
ncbi:hypothetical protein RI129_001181 [Pyrocoelia pectoralis]|uniref:SWIM-type domain-containing protein n=1 Tax=Pyrocoelia pectoralis TaxID=417401 RepID=A0AAN7ZPI5_9COLE